MSLTGVLGAGSPLFASDFSHVRFSPVHQVDLIGGVRVVTLDRAA